MEGQKMFRKLLPIGISLISKSDVHTLTLNAHRTQFREADKDTWSAFVCVSGIEEFAVERMGYPCAISGFPSELRKGATRDRCCGDVRKQPLTLK